MIDMEAIDQHSVLGGDHVVIVVVRKVHTQAVGRLARLAMTDVVGKDDVILRDIEGLPRSEENVGKDRVEKGMGVAASAMQQKHGVVSVPGRVGVTLAEREVV